MKIATIIGARPQFIKSAPVSKAILDYNKLSSIKSPPVTEIIIHTGQHFDDNMSNVFFRELDIPEPAYNLGINSVSHGAMTGRMLEKIEEIIVNERPDWVIVYGDTNSTLSGALAASKLHIPIAHVEAGLRSFNKEMPEEINRILTDHCADMLFCPTETAVNNLKNEGFTNIINDGKLLEDKYVRNELSTLSFEHSPVVINVGDAMYDAVLQFSKINQKRSTILKDLRLKSKEFILATVHRPDNTDNPENLQNILSAFLEIDEPIIFPVHPRTKQNLINSNEEIKNSKIRCISPVGYLDMLSLEQNAKATLTDSGGMQKEAYFFGIPCVTMRTETEWVETVEAGWNVVVGADREKIINAVKNLSTEAPRSKLYGDGKTARKIINCLIAGFNKNL